MFTSREWLPSLYTHQFPGQSISDTCVASLDAAITLFCDHELTLRCLPAIEPEADLLRIMPASAPSDRLF